MDALSDVVDRHGGSLLTEDFNPVGANTQSENSKDGEFTVELLRSGVSVEVVSGQTIIEARQAANIKVDTSSEAGVCGTCVVDYVMVNPSTTTSS